ncbi:MAG: hypothetical protein K0U45_09140 [Alphaproteobacteria bacterium]|nr:hypothetical protein [Alphaproteobacteria bacterium]
MQKQIHIKIFLLLLCTAPFALPAYQANAQEIGGNEKQIDEAEKLKIGRYSEVTFTSGRVSYTNPSLWTNDFYSSIGFRWVSRYLASNLETYIEFEFGETNYKTSPIDGLIRSSSYEKLGYGFIFNKSPKAETSFFVELGAGLFNVDHYVKGEAAWRAPESDEISNRTVTYRNDGISYFLNDIYLNFAIGAKIKNNHKLSLYIQPLSEGDLSARGTSNDGVYPDDAYDYHGKIPQNISNGMMGIRYSYVFR